MSPNTKTSDRSYGHSHQQLRKAWPVASAGAESAGDRACRYPHCIVNDTRERGVFWASEKNRHPAGSGISLPDLGKKRFSPRRWELRGRSRGGNLLGAAVAAKGRTDPLVEAGVRLAH
jgi:hypothetical protein